MTPDAAAPSPKITWHLDRETRFPFGRIAPDPIRELYVVGADETDDSANYRTDICWPIRPA